MNGKILFQKDFEPLDRQKICLFSTFDAKGEIPRYVNYYLKQLRALGFRIFLVSTSPSIDRASMDMIEPSVDMVFLRENIGLDFASWKLAYTFLGGAIHSAECVLLANDSVIGPLGPLDPVFEYLDQSPVGLGGITTSEEIALHIQSYFLYFNRKSIKARVLSDFFDLIQLHPDKDKVIRLNEVGISQKLISEGRNLNAWTNHLLLRAQSTLAEDSKLENTHNLTLFHWEPLLRQNLSPFLKKSLFFGSPVDAPNITRWKTIVSSNFEYDVSLIEDYLERHQSKYR